MILKHREDISQIFLAGIGPIILISATAIETLTSLNSFLIWGIVWLLICRNNYVLHNHAHSPMFTSKRINRLCNIIFGLTAGMPAGNWKIMHVHGHHVEHRKGARQGRKYIERFIIPDDTRDSFGISLNMQFGIHCRKCLSLFGNC